MLVGVTRCGALLLVLGAAMATPTTEVQSAQPRLEDKLTSLVDGIDQGTIEVEAAARTCADAFAAEAKVSVVRDMIAGFLDVPREDALMAGCRAVALALESKRISAGNLHDLLHGTEPQEKTLLSGLLLREMYFAHRSRP